MHEPAADFFVVVVVVKFHIIVNTRRSCPISTHLVYLQVPAPLISIFTFRSLEFRTWEIMAVRCMAFAHSEKYLISLPCLEPTVYRVASTANGSDRQNSVCQVTHVLCHTRSYSEELVKIILPKPKILLTLCRLYK